MVEFWNWSATLTKEEWSGRTVDWSFMFHTINFSMSQVRLGGFSWHKMEIVFMGILLPALSQNGLKKSVVWIFGGQSTVPLHFSSLTMTKKWQFWKKLNSFCRSRLQFWVEFLNWSANCLTLNIEKQWHVSGQKSRKIS